MLHAHVVASLTFEIGLPQGVAGVDLQNYTTIWISLPVALVNQFNIPKPPSDVDEDFPWVSSS